MSSTTSTSTTASATSSSTACVTMTPGKNGYVPAEACNSLYAYNPSLAAAVIFAVIFGILSIVHIFLGFKWRKRFTWVVIMGALWETGSMASRAYGTQHQQNTGAVTASLLLILLAPLWINAFVYMTLGRAVYFFLPAQKIWGVKATKFSVLFIWLDIVSFLVQAVGGIMVSGTNVPADQLKLGMKIYMAGIGVQQGFICIFTVMMIQFHRKMSALDRSMQITGKSGWRKLIYALYATLAMITMRIIYRLFEYSRGTDTSNPVLTHEVYMYVLDAMPMSFALAILAAVHPGSILQGEGSEFPKMSRKEKKAAKEIKKRAKKEAKAAKKNGFVEATSSFASVNQSDEEQHVPLNVIR